MTSRKQLNFFITTTYLFKRNRIKVVLKLLKSYVIKAYLLIMFTFMVRIN